MITSPSSHLAIRGVELLLSLGWDDSERATNQTVMLDLDIHFREPPLACRTDELQDTFCYDKLITDLYTHVTAKSYRLIEHLCEEIYQDTKPKLPAQATLTVRVTKYPSISHLTGSVSFSYGDGSLS